MRQVLKWAGFAPIRRIGRAVAGRWPWPVPVVLDQRRIYLDLRSGIGRAIFMQGEFDPEVFSPLRTTLRPGSTFVDVGANVGYYSLLALDRVGATGSVHAFEIDERPLKCLTKTVAANDLRNLHVHAVAVGAINGHGSLRRAAECGHSTVFEAGEGHSVRMATLDSLAEQHGWERVSGLKIDVEGGELAVLRGASELLRLHRPLVVCEVVASHLQEHGCAKEDVLGFLRDHDYDLKWLPGVYTPTIVASPL